MTPLAARSPCPGLRWPGHGDRAGAGQLPGVAGRGGGASGHTCSTRRSAGPAYAEFAALPWAATEASRLEERRRLAVERRAEAMLRLNAAAEAVPDLETHVAADPLREEAWRLLALALYRAGRQGDALDALRRARAALAEELGVDPGPALRRLEHDILTQAPALETTDLRAEAPSAPYRVVTAPAEERDAESGPASRGGRLRDQARGTSCQVPAGPAGAPGALRGSPYVGRRAELERLRAAAERGGLALVSGDAGMGKTSLAERLAAALAAEGRRCAWGRAPETGGAPAAWPWAEILRDLAADTPPADDRLAPLLDDAAAAAGDAAAGDAAAGDATAARFRLHLAVADYLAGLAARTPLLLVLDDLHWADDETLALLVRVLGRVRELPVLVVGTFRHTEAPDRLTAALAAFARHEPTRVALDGLSAAEVAVLVRAVCRAEVGDAELAAIAERTGGNPFFARETARLLDAEGPAAATGAVPAGVGDVLRRRLARLPEPARAVLRDAAVVGRDADLAVLADLSGDEDAVLDAVEAGLAAGLVTEPAPGRMRFAHALVRDTLYADLSRARRVRLHGRVAAALERHRPGEVAALAHHHLEAGTDPDRAVRYARLAAEAAEGRFAHATAADLYERAADTLRARGRTGEALEIEAAAIRACALAGRVVRARERRLRAVAEARALGDLALLARVVVAFDVPTLWTSRKYNTVDHEIVEAAEAALAGPPGADPELRVRLLTSVAIELEGEPQDRGPRAAEEAVAAARALGRPRLLAVALNGLFLNSYRSAGDNDQRLRIAEEMLDLATRHGLATYRVLAHLLLQQAHVTGLDLAAADAHRAEGLRLADQYGLPLLALIGSWYRALGHVVAGRYAEAERAYTEIAASIARTGVWGSERGVEAFGIFCVRTFQGREGEMAEQMRWVRDNWPDVGAAADLHALALAARGRLAEARAAAEGAAPVRRDYFFDLAMTFRARLAVALDDRDLAAGCYTALLPYAGRLAGGGCAVATVGPVAQTLGDVAAYLGRPGEAAEHYATAERVAERVGAAGWARTAREARDALGTTAA
ncbi:ATP-binding protein [Actinomadura kijaniata]|uniref:ATP-binding protein n=1 Tax=Actinomadura kijaniata TaxID=46161 RepID=UPI003F1CEC3B